MNSEPEAEVFDFVADERNELKYNPEMTMAEKVTDWPSRSREEVSLCGGWREPARTSKARPVGWARFSIGGERWVSRV